MFKSLVLAGAMALAAIPAQAQTCTRDYLKTFIASYFKAVETHDLSALPTAPNLTKDHDWEVPLPAGQRPTRSYMNEHANRYFSSFAKDPTEPDANYATPCHRWEGGLQTTVKNPSCSPRGTGLIMTHTHRRFPVTDTETGATAGFILFGGGLPDVHMFKFDQDGRIYSIQAVFAGRVSPDTQIWPDEK